MDNSTHNMSEKLVDYLDGKLDEAEMHQIDELLAADQSLSKEFESLLLTREAVKQYGLKQKVSSVHKEMIKERQVPVKKLSNANRPLRYAIAIAASILLIIGGYIGYNFYVLSSERVFAANFQSYELNTVRDAVTTETEMEKTYKEGKYKEVIEFSYDRPFTIKEDFLRAMAFSETGDNSNAILSFKRVMEENKTAGTSIFNDEAEFYLALVYIRNKDFDFALELLKKIQSDPEHLYYSSVTKKLVRQVKMLKWR